AAAILDRILERGRFIHLDGPSGRTRHLKLEEILPAKPERFRISGINGSEFPEPTFGLVLFNITMPETMKQTGTSAFFKRELLRSGLIRSRCCSGRIRLSFCVR